MHTQCARTNPLLKLCAAALTTLFVAAPHAQAMDEVDSPIRISPIIGGDPRLLPLSIDPAALERLQSSRKIMIEQFPLTATQSVNLEMRRIEVFAPGAVIIESSTTGDRTIAPPKIVVLSGAIQDKPGSYAFLSLGEGLLNGYIDDGENTYFLTNGRGGTQTASLYRARDFNAGELAILPPSCGAAESAQYQTRLLTTLNRPNTERELTITDMAPRNIDIAFECDFEFSQKFQLEPKTVSAYVATLVGAVSAIYRDELNARLRISYLRVWTTVDDPWTQLEASQQLSQFKLYWLVNQQQVSRHTAHLLSSRQLTNAGGTAYLAGLCNSDGFGLSGYLNGFFPLPVQDNRPQNWDVYVLAHELGHNFDALHTHEMSPPIDLCGLGDCNNALTLGTIMSYCHTCPGGLSNIRLTFHPRVPSERIAPYLESLGCNLVATGPCVADINRDTAVNGADLTEFLSAFGSETLRPYTHGDMNGDRIINGSDLSVFLRSFGQDCP